VLRALLEGLQEALGQRLVGAYLQGAFALGAADEHSDVDFIVAVRELLEDDEVARLQELHSRVHELPSHWARVMEGSYFPVAVLRDCARRGEALWYLDNGARRLVESPHCNTAVVRSIVRDHGVVLHGPDPRALIDPVPVALLRAEVHASLRALEREMVDEPDRFASRFYQGFAVLNACRLWCDLMTGEPGSKRRGAKWAKARLDVSWADLIDRAWETRPDPATSVRTPAEPTDIERTLAFVRLVVARCEDDGRTAALAPSGA
jgi:hypothetical protein